MTRERPVDGYYGLTLPEVAKWGRPGFMAKVPHAPSDPPGLTHLTSDLVQLSNTFQAMLRAARAYESKAPMENGRDTKLSYRERRGKDAAALRAALDDLSAKQFVTRRARVSKAIAEAVGTPRPFFPDDSARSSQYEVGLWGHLPVNDNLRLFASYIDAIERGDEGTQYAIENLPKIFSGGLTADQRERGRKARIAKTKPEGLGELTDVADALDWLERMRDDLLAEADSVIADGARATEEIATLNNGNKLPPFRVFHQGEEGYVDQKTGERVNEDGSPLKSDAAD